jgi:subtilisin family serine protease
MVLFVMVLLLPTGLHAAVRSPKIETRVAKAFAQGETTRALIVMAEQAEVSAADALPTKQQKGAYVFNTLRATAERTQANVRALLTQRGMVYRAYVIANVIAVENLDAAAAAQIAARPEVARIAGNADVKFSAPVSSAPSAELGQTIEWNLKKIGADKIWAEQIRGQGIVVANQDTGVQWDHPALKNKYRGYNRKTDTVNHNYNWWDAIHGSIVGGGNVCGYNAAAPCDDYGHGTHTIGTIVGGTKDNKIGVAPRAKWISCRNMDNGVGRPSTYIECFEFFLAPWDSSGNNPDPNQAPDVVSNSWSCPPSELCAADTLQTATENLRAAGIFVVASAGNSGSSCSTISDPSAIYDASTTVGATDSSDALASFSSRGPVTKDGSNRRKPDLSAPGVAVRSSVPGGGYSKMSGTSMAAPHVAGAVALLWQADPALRGKVSKTEKFLFHSANSNVQAGSQVCGGTDKSMIPNNLFGYGRLNVWKAYQNVK